MRAHLLTVLLLATPAFLLAAATPAGAVDIDCRGEIMIACWNGSQFCHVWINNAIVTACVHNNGVIEVLSAATDIEPIVVP